MGENNSSNTNMVWYNGTLIPYKDAKVPVLTHSLQYGSGIFEGIRSYPSQTGSNVFRLREHMKRFLKTAKIYGMNLGFTHDQLVNAVIETVYANKLKSCYIRPFAFIDDDSISISTKGKRVSVTISVIPYDSIFGTDKLKGIRCKVSSWKRLNSSILPIQAKASGNYLNSIIALNEATMLGYNETIILSDNGYVAEGSGENIFLVKDKKLITPGDDSDVLLGITRDSIITTAREMNMEVVMRNIHRDELYNADEIFLCGTAAEVAPVIEVDGTIIGDGRIGKVTSEISGAYDKIVNGETNEHADWLSPVEF